MKNKSGSISQKVVVNIRGLEVKRKRRKYSKKQVSLATTRQSINSPSYIQTIPTVNNEIAREQLKALEYQNNRLMNPSINQKNNFLSAEDFYPKLERYNTYLHDKFRKFDNMFAQNNYIDDAGNFGIVGDSSNFISQRNNDDSDNLDYPEENEDFLMENPLLSESQNENNSDNDPVIQEIDPEYEEEQSMDLTEDQLEYIDEYYAQNKKGKSRIQDVELYKTLGGKDKSIIDNKNIITIQRANKKLLKNARLIN